MISFVFSDYDYYYSDYLRNLLCVCLVVNPNTLGRKPRLSCIDLFLRIKIQNHFVLVFNENTTGKL